MSTVTVQHAFAQALQHHQAGRLGEAEALYRQILAVAPDHADALHYLGVVAHQSGRDDLAVPWIGRAIAREPGNFAAHYNLGEALHTAGQWEEAMKSFRRALELQPDQPQAHNNIGVILAGQGKPGEAIRAFQRALQLHPGFAIAHNNLGNALKDQGRRDEAMAAYRRALQLKPDYVEAHSNLAIALAEEGRLEEASAMFRHVLGIRPGNAEAHKNLGITLVEQGRLEEAIAEYRRALQLRPDYAEAHNTLGNALNEQWKPDEAITELRRALALKPDHVEARNNLGFALKNNGQWAEGVAEYRRALELKPDDARVHSNLIYALHFCPAGDDGSIAEEHRRWNRQFSDPVKEAISRHTNAPDPQRRLKIGYVSPDFRSHPVSFFLLPLLEAHAHGQFEIYCYANPRRTDTVTERFQKSADVWRDTRGLSDAQFAESVRRDGVDILVDVAMHTAGNRLPVFARKPAPVQVSWLAYPGSTGVETIDYRLTDAQIDPPGLEENGLGGRIVRLPDAWCCYAPVEELPGVSPLPAATTGAVTFGSLNQFNKLHGGLLRGWARLLGVVPGSRLLLICPEGEVRERTQSIFTSCGVAPQRLEFVTPCSWADYLRLFGRIDVMLDAYPCNGMTTNCHSLWMGVPVVTRTGTGAVSRAGSSLLHAVGLSDWVAPSEEEYLRIAAERAADLSHLAQLRATLRARMQSSPLMDAPRFARQVEAAYRTMWQRWCAEHPVFTTDPNGA